MLENKSKTNQKVCPYCGQDLPFKTYTILGTSFQGLEPCTCARAVKAAAEKETNIKRNAQDKAVYNSLVSAGIPLIYENIDISEGEFNSYFDAGEKGKKTSVFITGKIGSGKTMQACGLLKRFARRHLKEVVNGVYAAPSLEFISSEKMYQLLRKQFSDTYYDDYTDYENVLLTADLLCIDDVGKEKPSEWTIEKLFTIVNARYEKKLPTIYTSNYEIDVLGKRLAFYGNTQTAEAIVSRLYETTNQVYAGDKDWRKKNGKTTNLC